MYRSNALKQNLKAGRNVVGCWTMLGNPHALEILALAGYDYLLLDLEHGIGDPSSLATMLMAISATKTTSVVRVPWNDHVYLKRVLDAGAEGVMIPSIETAEEARAAVAACRYPLAGRRGTAASSVRASSYGMGKDYVATAADNLLIVLQIESAKGVQNIDEILKVEGIDVVFIGPYDLSATVGRMGDLKHPQVAGMIETVEKKAKAAKIPLGTVPHTGVPWMEMFKRGYQFVNSSSDVAKLRESSLAEVKTFREAYPG